LFTDGFVHLQVHVGQRREWKNAREWGKTLSRLPRLQHLSLRTSISVTYVPGNHEQEYSIVSRWAGCNTPHPALKRIVLWYLYGMPQSHMSFWERYLLHEERLWSNWEKTNDIAAPDAGLFV
jgi:hypothetical protein